MQQQELLRAATRRRRGKSKQVTATPVEGQPRELKPWREVVTPHRDVASGATSRRSSPPTCTRCGATRRR